jgi:pyruvate dehydrogenase E2 component (dihydrolipoamide acetyltransferase)
MPTEIVMPALGMAQESITLVRWLRAEGETVAKGDPLMEVETDKAVVEIEAPASGTLSNVTAAPGDRVPVGNTIAMILAPGERGPKAARQLTGHLVTPAGSEVKKKTQLPAARGLVFPGRIAASPAARRIAREKGIDLARVKGTAPGGSIVAEDVSRAAVGQRPVLPGSVPTTASTPLSPMRRVVGERMAQSKQTVPHFYVSVEVDMSAVEGQRTKRKGQGAKIVPSVNDWVLWGCARALKEFPSLNSTLAGQGIGVYSEINLGVAVALEEGLVVPVIRNADRLSLKEIAHRSRELTEKAHNKKLLPGDCEGGTFTVSNLGMFGADHFIAIINPPQCAILAVGRVAPRVVPLGEQIAIRAMMTMTLSADHRIVDGAIAARFLQEVKRLLEQALL